MYLSRLILNPRSRDVRHDLSNCHDLHRTIMRGFPDLRADSSPVNGDVRAQLGVLFRLETHPRVDTASVMVQSRVAPDWTGLPGGYLLDSNGQLLNPDTKRVDGAYATISAGAELVFRLRANPTKRLAPSTGVGGVRRDGKRVELRTEAELLRWLTEKGTGNVQTGRGGGGFRLIDVRARPGVAVAQTLAAPSAVADVRTGGAGKLTGVALRSGVAAAQADTIGAVTVAGAVAAASDGAAVRQRLTFGDVLFEGRLMVTDAALFRQTLEQGIGSGKAYGFGLLSVAPGVG